MRAIKNSKEYFSGRDAALDVVEKHSFEEAVRLLNEKFPPGKRIACYDAHCYAVGFGDALSDLLNPPSARL